MKKEYNPYDYQNKNYNNKRHFFYLFNKLLTMFKYKNLPDTLPQVEIEKRLLLNGYVCVAEYENNLYAFDGGLGGELDVYYRPTTCIVANPALKLNKVYEIDKDCIILKNDSNLEGMKFLLEKYSTFLTENEISMMVTLFNNRLFTLLSASDDNTKASANEFLQKLKAGDLGVIADNAFLESLKVHGISHTLHAMQDIITCNQYIRATFLNDIGLEANTQLKKERLVSAEVEINSGSLYPTPDDMLHTRQEGIDAINQMFGTDIEIEFTSSWDYRSYAGANIINPAEVALQESTEGQESTGEEVTNTDVPVANINPTEGEGEDTEGQEEQEADSYGEETEEDKEDLEGGNDK